MTSASSSQNGRFVWHDLMTPDAARAEKFYVDLFGWRVEETLRTGTPYRMLHGKSGPFGGINLAEGAPHWMGHILVTDCDRITKQSAEAGGRTLVKPTDIPNVGRFAVLSDPLGASFSVFTRTSRMESHDIDAMVAGSPCWNELLTRDDIKAMHYYDRLFGWKDAPKDLGPMGTYHVQMMGETRVCGIMKNPMNGAPDAWLLYFLAPELRSFTDKATRLGAKAFVSNMPIPDVGAFSMFSDPTGAMFALFEPSMSAISSSTSQKSRSSG